MEPSPVRPSTGYLSYLITGLKNPDVEIPDKCVSELPVSALQMLMRLVAYVELLMRPKSHSFACVVLEAAWGDSHIPRFSPLPAISGYVLPPFSSPAFWHPGAVCSHISIPSALSVLLE